MDNTTQTLARALAAAQVPVPDVIVPTMETLLQGDAAAGWLMRDVRALLSQDDVLLKVQGIALLARLWTPNIRASGGLSAAMAAVADGETPSRRAQAWWAGLPADTRSYVVDLACAAADQLSETLGDFVAAVPGLDPDARVARGREILHGRDNLQSLRYMLGRDSLGERLRGSLEALDAVAARNLSIWAFVPQRVVEGDRRLREVRAWRDMDAWWVFPGLNALDRTSG